MRPSDPGRRRLLQALAATLALPAGGAPLANAAQDRRIAVVGAGAFGGWTALSLQRAGADVTLVDAWGPGNARASSGGESRVIRAIYGADRVYARMVADAWGIWEALDATTDDQLLTPTGALWMLRSPEAAYVEAALPIVAELGFPTAELTLAEAAARWPQIRFDGVARTFFEEKAGVLYARRCCEVVRERFREQGGSFRQAWARPDRMSNGRLGALALSDGSSVEADAFVFACGPWLGSLFPEVIGDRVRATRQDVLYFGAAAGEPNWGPDRLPVWIDFGERIFYGLPDTHRRGFKIADDTRGAPIDPNLLERLPEAASIERARRLLGERFPALAGAPLLESRVCQYENSPDGDLILDRHPEAENVWLAGGGSGHGFKLAPVVGMELAAAVLGQGPLDPKFGLARLAGEADRRTQFERS